MVTRLILATLLSALLVPASAVDEPEQCDDFATRPQDVVAVLGEITRMDCAYSSSLPVNWEMDGTSIIDEEGGQFTLFANGSLQFNSVTEENAGTYVCIVQTGFGMSARCSGDLRLAESPTISSKTGPGDADSDTRTLSAVVTGDPLPSVEWRKNDDVLSNSSRISILTVPSGANIMATLVITSVTKEDRGVYELRASSSAGRATTTWDVPVNFVEAGALRKTYNGSTSATFTCTARAFPRGTTEVSWVRVKGTQSNALADGLTTNFVFQDTQQHWAITSSVRIELSSCQGSSEVVKCSVSSTNTGASVELGGTICLPACTPPGISVSAINCTSVRVAWQPVDSGVNNYIIHHRLESSTLWQSRELNSSTTSVDIGGLKGGTAYVFRSSCNSVAGPFSSLVMFSTPSAPPVVTGVSLELLTLDKSFFIKVQWQASTDHSITGYLVQVFQDGVWTSNNTVQGQDTSYQLPISCGVRYSFKVAAFNDYSRGPFSYPVQKMCDVNIPSPQRVKFEPLPNTESPFQPLPTSLTIGYSLEDSGLVTSFKVDVEQQNDDFQTVQTFNYTIAPVNYGSGRLCITELISNAQYQVCLRVTYGKDAEEKVCARTETPSGDTVPQTGCLSPTAQMMIIIEPTPSSTDTSPAVPDWGIAVIVVGALVLVALLFCFLGLCFACQTSRSKDVSFGSMSSLQTEREGVVAVRVHHPHSGQRAVSPTRSCLKYSKGHSTTWSDHVDTLRQMDTDNGTSV